MILLLLIVFLARPILREEGAFEHIDSGDSNDWWIATVTRTNDGPEIRIDVKRIDVKSYARIVGRRLSVAITPVGKKHLAFL